MANMYRSVLSGGGGAATGDAIASDVLIGKTFSNAQNTGIAGTMPNNGAVSGSATPSNPYTIPEGYHNGLGEVTGSGANYGTTGSYVGYQSQASNVPQISGTLPHQFASNDVAFINVEEANTLTHINASTNNAIIVLKNDGTATYIAGTTTSVDVSDAFGVIIDAGAGSGMNVSLT